MTSSPSRPSYKWWETDDKTKRLYTELLAEKLSKSSPRKKASNSSSLTLTRSLSDINFRRRPDLKNGNTSTTSASNVASSSSLSRGSPGRQEETKPTTSKGLPTASDGSPAKKYTFETITMETLAKYEYIKSPKKVPTRHSSLSLSSLSSVSSSSSSAASSAASSSSSEEESEKKTYVQGSPRNFQTGQFLSSKTEMGSGKASTSAAADSSNDEYDATRKWKWNVLVPTKVESGQGTSNASPAQSAKEISKGSPFKSSLLSESFMKTPTKSKKSFSSLGKTTTFDTSNWAKPNPTFMLMTSSQKPEMKTLGGASFYGGKGRTKELETKEKLSAALTKHEEVPEYKSSASGESSTDESSVEDNISKVKAIERLFQRDRIKPQDLKDKKEAASSEKKAHTKQESDGELKMTEMNKKYHSLCEEVEQLEFKMYEFSDDIHKLKMAMGMKETSEAKNVEYDRIGLSSPDGRPRYKHSFTFATGKDLLSDRHTAHALLMRKHASPCKSPRTVTKLLLDTGISKEITEAEAKRDKELEDQIQKINETEMTADEIHELMRNAKSKYIDNPNYLEDMGICTNLPRTKG